MKNYKSYLSIAVIGFIYFISAWFYKPYKSFYHQETGDAFGYYVYLPAFFIHHDLAHLQHTMAAKYSHFAPGKKVEPQVPNKYFMGTAVLQAPFFLAGHVLAKYLHQPQDGFSMAYMYMAQLSVITYSLLSLFLILIILRRRFTDGVIATVIVILGLATNLYYLAVEQAPFCHAYLLFLYCLLIYFSIRFYDSYKRRYILLIGWACGMIILTRLNELYAVIIPVVWGLHSIDDARDRIRRMIKMIWPVAAAIVIIVLCLVPQILYWKVSSGHYIYYSYQGESFNFRDPHIWGGLFSFNNGWLVYSPIMMLSIAGIWGAARRRDDAIIPIAIYLPVHIYVIYSWWCWFYMGSYGSRPMTEAYALLSIPMAYSVEWFGRSLMRKTVLSILSAFCIFVVTTQTYQSYIDIFNSELSNWRFNLITLGKTKLSYEESIILDTKEFQPSDPVLVKVLAEDDFEDSTIAGSDMSVATSGKRSVCVRQDQICQGYNARLKDIGAKPGQWIKASINCLAKIPTDHNWHLSPMVIMYERSGKMPKWRSVSLQNKINNPKRQIWHFPINEWGRVYFYSQVPGGMQDTDQVKIYVEHKNGPDIYIDDLKVELYDEK